MTWVRLQHPYAPRRVWVRAGLLRRLGLRRSRVATIDELAGSHWT